MSAQDAAGAQANQANNSAALADKQYQTSRTDLAPYRNSGALANARLMALLGIGNGGVGGSSMTAPVAPTREQYMKTGPSVMVNPDVFRDPTNARSTNWAGGMVSMPGTTTFDQTGYDSALSSYNSALDQYNQSQNSGASNVGGDYGSLLKQFTGADLQNEPGYQFALSEGNKAIDRASAAAGRYDSGAALKELARYGNDYASTKYNDAFNRDQTNKNTTYNFLAGQSGQGANAAAMTGNIGNTSLGLGNAARSNAGDATAAGYIGSANAVTGGLNSYLNNQNNQATLQYLKSRNAGSGTGWNTSAPSSMYGTL
jgi:hypothetical protein